MKQPDYQVFGLPTEPRRDGWAMRAVGLIVAFLAFGLGISWFIFLPFILVAWIGWVLFPLGIALVIAPATTMRVLDKSGAWSKRAEEWRARREGERLDRIAKYRKA